MVYIRRGDRHSQESVYLNFRNHLHRGIHQLQDWLIDHLDRRVTIDDMAKMVNMSARNLTRTFKLQTGISINHYITLLRLQRILKGASVNCPPMSGESLFSTLTA